MDSDKIIFGNVYELIKQVPMRREPTEDELAEIRKLPNFDEKVMNELIFGKGDKK
jgi:hypothetical protein